MIDHDISSHRLLRKLLAFDRSFLPPTAPASAWHNESTFYQPSNVSQDVSSAILPLSHHTQYLIEFKSFSCGSCIHSLFHAPALNNLPSP
jgi:hypothetical protein